MRTAASKGDAEVVEMLVKAKANINERDGKVNTSAAFPLYFPSIYISIVQQYSLWCCVLLPISVTCARACGDCVFLIQCINAHGVMQDESLIWSAASLGHSEVVEVLIEAKASIGDGDKNVNN